MVALRRASLGVIQLYTDRNVLVVQNILSHGNIRIHKFFCHFSNYILVLLVVKRIVLFFCDSKYIDQEKSIYTVCQWIEKYGDISNEV